MHSFSCVYLYSHFLTHWLPLESHMQPTLSLPEQTEEEVAVLQSSMHTLPATKHVETDSQAVVE